MTLEELKEEIENGSVSGNPIIFLYKDSDFICHQYIREISKIMKMGIDCVDEVADLSQPSVDIFSSMDSLPHEIEFFHTDSIDEVPVGFRNRRFSYIATEKIGTKAKKEYEDLIIVIPKIEDWQIRDYVYSTADGVSQKDLDWIIGVCKKDLFRIDSELDKLRLFNKEQRQDLFEQMKNQRVFSDLSPYNVFDLTNSVTKRDLSALSVSLSDIDSYDAEPLGVVSILLTQFKKLILVLLHPNPTEETTGLKSNVIYAIKKSGAKYSKAQLVKSFEFLCDVDRRLKTGEIDTKWLIDWVICNILTF